MTLRAWRAKRSALTEEADQGKRAEPELGKGRAWMDLVYHMITSTPIMLRALIILAVLATVLSLLHVHIGPIRFGR